MPAPSGGYGFIGSANTLAVGSGDGSGEWYSATVKYAGSMGMIPTGWIGKNDDTGDWMDGTGIYFGYMLQLAGGGAWGAVGPGFAFRDGFVGISFMKNVLVMTREFWDTALSNPYTGQLYPPGGCVGGPGQVFPF